MAFSPCQTLLDGCESGAVEKKTCKLECSIICYISGCFSRLINIKNIFSFDVRSENTRYMCNAWTRFRNTRAEERSIVVVFLNVIFSTGSFRNAMRVRLFKFFLYNYAIFHRHPIAPEQLPYDSRYLIRKQAMQVKRSRRVSVLISGCHSTK